MKVSKVDHANTQELFSNFELPEESNAHKLATVSKVLPPDFLAAAVDYLSRECSIHLSGSNKR